jgi:hypothetical protein
VGGVSEQEVHKTQVLLTALRMVYVHLLNFDSFDEKTIFFYATQYGMEERNLTLGEVKQALEDLGQELHKRHDEVLGEWQPRWRKA